MKTWNDVWQYLCQKRGYGFFTPYAQFALAGAGENATPVLQAGMDMGIGYNVNNNLGIHVGIGAYRSIRSFNNINEDNKNSKDHTESASGPRLFAGLDWFILPENTVCPRLSFYAGYQFLISSFHDEPLYDTEGIDKGIYNIDDSDEIIDARYIPVKDYTWFGDNYHIQHGANGLFLGLKAGTDFKINNITLNVSLSYELSQYHDGAFAGDRQEKFGYFGDINAFPSYRPWKVPFFQKFRNVFGFSVSLII